VNNENMLMVHEYSRPLSTMTFRIIHSIDTNQKKGVIQILEALEQQSSQATSLHIPLNEHD